MSQDPREMLEQYRATTTAQFKTVVNGFNKLGLADRDELTFYVVSYMTNQYAELIGHVQMLTREVAMLQQMVRSLTGSPQGKPN